jgi:hypothetical protein
LPDALEQPERFATGSWSGFVDGSDGATKARCDRCGAELGAAEVERARTQNLPDKQVLCSLCVGVPELKNESGAVLRPIPQTLENQKTAIGMPALNLPMNRFAKSAAILVPISRTLENQKTAVGMPALPSPGAQRDITAFFFCEKCGKRVTDKQLQAGEGRDKKVKGVYCKECAAGVLTVEFEAVNPEQEVSDSASSIQSAEPAPAGAAPISAPSSPDAPLVFKLDSEITLIPRLDLPAPAPAIADNERNTTECSVPPKPGGMRAVWLIAAAALIAAAVIAFIYAGRR